MIELNKIYNGDCLDLMRQWPDEFIDCCVTSPPYWGLRDYGVDGQFGLESTPEEYVAKLVEICQEVKRVLKPEGTLWLNLGDSYCGEGRGCDTPKQKSNKGTDGMPKSIVPPGMKQKDLAGIPWMVAFALRQDGWYLRQDIIWHKPNPMPESVKDRCTKAHEYIFLLSKNKKYYYDADAIKEPSICPNDKRRPLGSEGAWQMDGREQGENGGGKAYEHDTSMSNKRSVWMIPTRSYKEAHFATFPPDLITPCILAGCPKDGVVLDPFMGSGTTAMVAYENNRNYIGCELNPEYIKMNRADKAKEKYGLFNE